MTNLLLTPGPTPIPPDGRRGGGAAAAAPPQRPSSRTCWRGCWRRLQRVYRTERDVILFSSSGTGGGRVGVREPALARRPDPGRLGRQLRRALGEDGRGVPRRRRGAALALGRRGPTRTRWPSVSNGRDDLAAVFVVHSETSTGATADVRGDRRADARALELPRRRRHLVARRDAARDRRLGARRRRHRLAEGADDAARAWRSRRSRSGPASARRTRPNPRFSLDWERALERAGARARRRSRRPSRWCSALDAALGDDRGGRASRRGSSAPVRLGRGIRGRLPARWGSSCSRPTATTARSSPPRCGRRRRRRGDPASACATVTASRSRAARAS